LEKTLLRALGGTNLENLLRALSFTISCCRRCRRWFCSLVLKLPRLSWLSFDGWMRSLIECEMRLEALGKNIYPAVDYFSCPISKYNILLEIYFRNQVSWNRLVAIGSIHKARSRDTVLQMQIFIKENWTICLT